MLPDVNSFHFPRNLKNEFARLKEVRYLDHAASSLYSDSQIESILDDLKNHLYGNPHSLNSSSKLCHDSVDQIRFRILQHFGTTADEYSVIFTSGATSALKSTAEWFDWNGTERIRDRDYNDSGDFVYTKDNHTSVLGLREIANERGVRIHCLEHNRAFEEFRKNYKKPDASAPCGGNSLFVYPAQCNFSGCKYPLQWIEKVHNGILNNFVREHSNPNNKSSYRRWFCLLDAAAFLSTNQLNLSVYKPDFVAVSFHKIFGYPTGLGALIVRNSSAHALKKSYYGGGTVLVAMSSDCFHVKKELLHERCEDGTINYLSVLSLRHGFDTMYRLGGKIDQISLDVFALTQYLHAKMSTLHHSNGQPAVILYRDTDYSDITTQGSIINFNLLRANGEYIGYSEVLNIANLYDIHLRTGCFCNPGACQRHLKLTDEQLKENYAKGHTCSENIDLIDGFPTGSVRVSFGYMSDKEDADSLFEMIVKCFVSAPCIIKTPDNWASLSATLRLKFEDRQNNSENGVTSAVKRSVVGVGENLQVSRHFGDTKTVTLAEIFVFPIKSCGAFRVHGSWPLSETGLKHDREWMLIKNGVSLTQKQIPEMCLIIPDIRLTENLMFLKYKDSSLQEPISLCEDHLKSGENRSSNICQSKVCHDKAEVIDCGDAVSKWLEKMLKVSEIRLVRFVDRNKLMKSKTSVEVSPRLSLTNQAQYLLVTCASVKWLVDQMSSEWDCSFDDVLQRFRSNFVISGECEPLEEFTWSEIRAGPVRFKVEGPCQRCQMICVNQSSGEKSKEPLIFLSSALKGKLKFGIYLSLPHSLSTFNLQVGQSIIVISRPDEISTTVMQARIQT